MNTALRTEYEKMINNGIREYLLHVKVIML